MWLVLQQEKPGDYVVGTGETHSIREFLEEAFAYVDLDWGKYVIIDQKYFRPTEVEVLIADSSKIRKEAGWEPKICFKDLVRIMVDADMEATGLTPPGEGRAILAKNGLITGSSL
jgi:GDPmannose 4,6-dehydratase